MPCYLRTAGFAVAPIRMGAEGPQHVYRSKWATRLGFSLVSGQVEFVRMPAAIQTLPSGDVVVGLLEARVIQIAKAGESLRHDVRMGIQTLVMMASGRLSNRTRHCTSGRGCGLVLVRAGSGTPARRRAHRSWRAHSADCSPSSRRAPISPGLLLSSDARDQARPRADGMTAPAGRRSPIRDERHQRWTQ